MHMLNTGVKTNSESRIDTLHYSSWRSTLIDNLINIYDVYCGPCICLCLSHNKTFLCRFSLSTAIFAPGWVKEKLGDDHFEENQAKFWSKLAPHCIRHAIIFPHPYFYTNFHPGIELEGTLRYLHLNQQSLFPHMSSVAFRPVPVGQYPHEVAVSHCSDQTLFSTKMPVERFDADNFNVYVTIKDPTKTSFDVKLRCGKELLKASSIQCRDAIKDFSFGSCAVEEILCSTTNAKVDVQEFILTFNPLKADVFGSQWMDATSARGIDLSLDDVSWKRSENSTYILLSCTLLMKWIDTTLPVTVFYQSCQTRSVKLGVAYCDRFRIRDLHVPDPVHHGPSTKIMLEVKQLNPIPLLLCESYGFDKVRCGELNITYGEKTGGPPCPLSKES